MRDTLFANQMKEKRENNLSEMELIEVLWKQDIDLGIGKEMFDNTLRHDLEKDGDTLQKNSSEESKKEEKPEGDTSAFPLLDLSGNYVVDGETGELLPGPPLPSPDSEPASEINFLDFPNLLSSGSELPAVDDLPLYDNELPTLEQLDNSQTSFQSTRIFEVPPQQPPAAQEGTRENLANFLNSGLSRQNSLEETWQDIFGLLDLQQFPTNDNNTLDLGLTTAMASTPLVPQPIVQNVSFGNNSIPDRHFLPQGFQHDSSSALALFQDVDVNVTYQATGGPLMASATLQSPTNRFSDINISQVTTDVTPFNPPMVPGFGSFEESNISNPSAETLEALFHNFFDNNTFDSGFGFEEPTGTNSQQFTSNEISNEPSISLTSDPTLEWYRNVMDQSDGVDEATGGKEEFLTCDMEFDKYSYDPQPDFSTSPSLQVNSSTSSNDTSFRSSKSITKQFYHNHTYALQPGQASREEREEALKREKEQKATRCRDEKKAKEMKLPFSIDDIIHTPVEEFTEMLSSYTLSEPQLQLIRDIRRRGKNKQAAQNCRKRKLDVIQSLEEEVACLNRERSTLIQDRHQMNRDVAQMKDKIVRLQTELFRTLRDGNGQSYNPSEYSLQQTPEGNIFLVPKSNVVEQKHIEKPVRKRKPKRKD